MPKTNAKHVAARKREPQSAKGDSYTRPNPKQAKISDTLDRHWELGKKVDAYCKSDFGKSIGDFAAQHGMPERTVRTLRTFYLLYPEPEFSKLKSIRRKGSDLPLNTGHVSYLLTVKTKVTGYGATAEAARHGFALEAAEKNYSPAQLNALIKRVCDRSSNNKGRPFSVSTLDEGMQQVANDVMIWTKRCRVTLEKMLSLPSVPSQECKQLRLLLGACREFCDAADELAKTRKDAEQQERAKALDKAQGRVSAIVEKVSAGKS